MNVVLQPGEFYFGKCPVRISTLLGSCVSICLWHPRLKIGGMCHYMLPSRARRRHGNHSGRYADEAFDLFLIELKRTATLPWDYELKLFGGGNMFLRYGDVASGLHESATRQAWLERNNIAVLNVATARSLAGKYGFKVTAEDLGGFGYRQVLFDLENGRAWCRHQACGCRGDVR